MSDFLSLSECVYSYMSSAEKPESSFRRYYNDALRCYKFMNLHAVGTPKTETVEVLSNKTAILPDDCLSVISVGRLDDSGLVQPIQKNTQLSLGESNSDDRLGQDKETGCIQIEGYRIDREANRIVFDFNFEYDEIVIEYLPMFSESCDDYIVSPYFEEAVIEWIGWKDRTQTPSDRANHERNFWNHFRIGKRSVNKFNILEAYKTYRKSLFNPYQYTICRFRS